MAVANQHLVSPAISRTWYCPARVLTLVAHPNPWVTTTDIDDERSPARGDTSQYCERTTAHRDPWMIASAWMSGRPLLTMCRPEWSPARDDTSRYCERATVHRDPWMIASAWMSVALSGRPLQTTYPYERGTSRQTIPHQRLPAPDGLWSTNSG